MTQGNLHLKNRIILGVQDKHLSAQDN